MEEKKYKIAIITAFIGNPGSSELRFTQECERELNEYGVDVYRFNNNDIDKLKLYFEPDFIKDRIFKETCFDKLAYQFNSKFKFSQQIYPTKEDNNSRLLAKIPKILFYKVVPNDYDYYIWLDSKFIVDEHWFKYILFLIKKYSSKNIITSRHAERSSIKKELEFMLFHMKKYSSSYLCSRYNMADMSNQVKKYLKESCFKDEKLFELGFIIYSKEMLNNKEFLDEWYAHNYYFTIQDQLSFPYLIQKHNIDVFGIRQDVYNMPFAEHD